MAQYRKIPVVIEAVRYTGKNMNEIKDFMQGGHVEFYDSGVIRIWTLESHSAPLNLNVGSWVVRGVQGEYYPVDNEIFTKTYEAV